VHHANGVVWQAVSPRVVREIPALRANLRIARRRERALRRVRCRARLRGGVRIVRFGPPPARLPDAAVGSPRDRVLRVEGPSFKGVRSGVERRRGRVLKEARDPGGRRDAPPGDDKVLKDRRSPRRRGRTGTKYAKKNAPGPSRGAARRCRRAAARPCNSVQSNSRALASRATPGAPPRALQT
jgi:hypothetical protein